MPVEELVLAELDTIIKELDEITIVSEFATLEHHLELGERKGVYFVRLDGAILFVGDSERSIAFFYNQIATVHEDEESGLDPGFGTLREILISRNDHIQEALERLGQNRLSKALRFIEFSPHDTEETLYSSIISIEKASGGTGGMEYVVTTDETNVPSAFIDDETPVADEIEPAMAPTPSGPGEKVVDEPKPNNVTHGSSMADGKILVGKYLTKAEDVSLSTKAIILDSRGRVLVLKDSTSDWWDLPGGHVQDDETLEAGLRREVFEETGLLVTSYNQIFVKNLALGNPPVEKPVVFFFASVMGDVVLSQEHTDAAWQSPDSLQILNLGVFLPVILEALQAGKEDIPDPAVQQTEVESLEKGLGTGGHEMEVTDLGQPFDTQTPRILPHMEKHHEPSAFDMGEPDATGMNVHEGRHQVAPREPTPAGENVLSEAGLTGGAQQNPEGVYARSRESDTDIPFTSRPGDAIKVKMGPGTGERVIPVQKTGSHGVPYTPPVQDDDHIPVRIGSKRVDIPINKTGYSEAGTSAEREKPFIEADHDASVSSDSRTIGVFDSGAVIDLPEEMAEEKGVDKNAVAGSGAPPGETGVGTAGTIGPVTTGDTFTPDDPGYDDMAREEYLQTRKPRSDFDASLTRKQHDMDVIGTSEGIATLPTTDAYSEGHKRYTVSRHEYEEELRHKNETGNPALPPEQKPLGQGESNLWLDGETSPNTNTTVPQEQGMDGKSSPANFDEANEQFTNLSAQTSGISQELLGRYVRKSGDSIETLKENFAVLNINPLIKAANGRPLVVAGWGSYYVVDQEGHRINLEGLCRALAQFLSKPEYANMNIFHSGIQVGKVLAEFVDEGGKVWKTEIHPEGMFVVCEFRTDLEVARRAMAEVLKGTLRGFSLAGNSNMDTKEIRCEHGVCWEEILDLELYEVTLCQSPMNQKSYITDIVQRPSPDICPECYEVTPAIGFDASLRPRW